MLARRIIPAIGLVLWLAACVQQRGANDLDNGYGTSGGPGGMGSAQGPMPYGDINGAGGGGPGYGR